MAYSSFSIGYQLPCIERTAIHPQPTFRSEEEGPCIDWRRLEHLGVWPPHGCGGPLVLPPHDHLRLVSSMLDLGYVLVRLSPKISR